MKNLLRTHLRHALLCSVCINVLALAPTLYLLQVYDRVLASRSLETLAMLAMFAGIALTTLLFQEIARGYLLGHAATALELHLAPTSLAARVAERAGLAPPRPTDIQQDLAALRGFLSGAGCIALFDAPWLIVYLLVIFLFHWSLGLLATLCSALLIGLAVINDRRAGNKVGDHDRQRRQAEHIAQEILANAEVIAAMGVISRLQKAQHCLRREAAISQTVISERTHRYKCITRWLRQLIQVAMMALGAWLVIEQHATGGVMLATTILLGKALAPIEQIIGNWKQFMAARSAWPRFEALLPHGSSIYDCQDGATGVQGASTTGADGATHTGERNDDGIFGDSTRQGNESISSSYTKPDGAYGKGGTAATEIPTSYAESHQTVHRQDLHVFSVSWSTKDMAACL